MFKKYDKPAAYLLFAVGVMQLIFLLSEFAGISEEPFSKILYEAFHFAALYLPGLSFFGSYLILKKPLNKKLFYYAAFSVIIFFPFSSVIKILFSEKKDLFIDTLHFAFDKPGSNTGSLLVLLSIILVLTLASRIVVKVLLGEKLINEVEVAEHIVSEPEVTVNNESESFSATEEIIDSNPFSIPEEDILPIDDPEPIEVQLENNDDLSVEIDKIKQEINEYYIEEEKNIPFEEPEFPETTEEVDIDAYDKSNEVLSEVVEAQLTKEEEEYLNSFDDVETFKPSESAILQEDPAYDFLADDSNEDYYNEDEFDNNAEFATPIELTNSNITEECLEDNEYYDVQNPAVVELQNNNEIVHGYISEDQDTSSVIASNIGDVDKSSEVSNEELTQQQRNPVVNNVVREVESSYDDINKIVEYKVPVNGLLSNNSDNSYMEIDEATKRSAAILEQTLEEFNIKGKVTGIKKGPVITMFELLPAPGVKLSKIVNLSDNIALGLAASNVRIVAPIPGKHAVGIEVPNKKRAVVPFSELIEAKDETYEEAAVPIILGKDISGDNKIIDLAKTPHLLIAGATGAGKSVCVNSLICSILCKRSHNDVKVIMVDPKIVELKLYNGIPHLLTPVITDPKRAFQAIQWCLYEMERRYALLDSIGVRDIKSYNKRIKEQNIATTKLPYMVLIVDEFADLMATSGKELEGILARLAAMSRAVGIHLVLATQRPSIDVITGLIKANFPSRIAFMVSSKTDSRIILDTMGAEKLLGRGDMLFTSSWDPFPVRIQGSFLSDNEVENVVDYVKGLGEPEYIDDEIFLDDEEDTGDISDTVYGDDPLFNRALEIVINAKKASASFLQRRLKIGYNRAARLVEEMEDRGIIGPQNGSKPREILRIPDSHKEVEEFV